MHDRVVGAILASWRYDISGISPEMRRDYESHFVECAHCSARQKFHRSLDVTLAVLTSLSAVFSCSRSRFEAHPPAGAYGLQRLRTRRRGHLSHADLGRRRGLIFSVIALALVLMPPRAVIPWRHRRRTRQLIEERLPRPSKRCACAKKKQQQIRY